MSKLPKGIDKRPSGLYRVRVAGFPSRSFDKLEDAIRHLEDLRRARQTGRMPEQVDADLIKLRELAKEHFDAEGDALGQRTFDSYVGQWKRNVLTHHIADKPLRMIGPRTVEEFRDDLLAADVGPASVRRTMTIMQTVMERAVRHGRITANPVKPVKKPSGKRKAAVKALAPKQVEAIRRQMKGADAVFVSLLAYSGVRPEEARALTWGDIKERTIVIDKAAEPDGTIKATKTERNRSARLLTPLRDDLSAFRVASGNPSDAALIFPRRDGGAWTDSDYRNWRKRKFRRAADVAGVDIQRPYDLRHSAASLWLHEGQTPLQVARWLGHSLAMLSSTYAHIIDDLDPDDRRPAADIIRAARQDKPRTRMRVLSSPKQSAA